MITTHTLNPENWNLSYREYLIRFALQRISDYGIAEDLVQDTFLSGWNAKTSFRGDCTERTWLTGILRNKIIDHYRKTGRRPSVLTTDLDATSMDEGDTFSWIDQQPDLGLTNRPEAETEKHEFLKDLEKAVTHLPTKMGRAYEMRELLGLSTDEITDELGISKANLWVLIHRAKQTLSEELDSEWNGMDEFGGRRAA
ncbi:MAG: sigma-70 family RNA polymerase sigma factor [Verrucomicrobiales bacterium]|nr:sigma-70 family RNA polymerase sigma factor [Verrucomicrobiales bacterium]